MSEVEIAIIGGGIAGLATAVALHTLGHKAHIFESAPAFQPLGTSLSLWPNAVACLSDWGLDKTLTDLGAPIDQIAWRQPDGRPYFIQPLAEIHAELGHQGICIRRSDLHATLMDAIAPDQLHAGHELTQFQDTGDAVKLHFANGKTATAKHVIAADGINSKIRKEIFNDGPPTYCGYGAWLGLSSAPSPTPVFNECCEFIGKDGRFGVLETGNDTRYWFFIANQETPSTSATLTDTKAVLNLISHWPAPFQDLVENTEPSKVTKVAFYDRKVARNWGAGNITLIGDAIHPFLPNLGQGACQAIEDAHLIAKGIYDGKTGPDLTKWLTHSRRKRVSIMQRDSRKTGALGQGKGLFYHFARGLFGKPPFDGIMRKQLISQFENPNRPRR